MPIQKDMHWLFWDVDVEIVDIDRDATYILARVLERGRLKDVKWAIQTYGLQRIHTFFKQTGHPCVSKRTLTFWRAFFNAREEKWQLKAPFRTSNSAPWIS